LDRVKVALFDTLGAAIDGALFLDLFAGTGGVGIEALSRGAHHATFVENSPRAARVLRDNLARTGFTDRARVVVGDVFRILNAEEAANYDFVFLAPPQYQNIAPLVLVAIDGTPGLKPDITVIVQQDPKEPKADTLSRLELFDERRYGTTVLLYYRVKPG
jgi:16S rRNA (guanine(966)-N(2))-methyltransferase RsmD